MTGRLEIRPDLLAQRLEALPGIDRVREAASGVTAYLVGGVIRDLLLGRARADLDVAIEGEVGEVARRLGGEQVRVHERFATATVRVDGLEVDLATTREESYASPGALPDVRPASLAQDLARRDFTVNAMAVPLAGEPELIDPHRGLADLRLGLLRVLHERSFVDDPTRALRAARYVVRFGFELEPGTEGLLREADLGTVSQERVEAELIKLSAEEQAGRGFELLDEWELVPLAKGTTRLIDSVTELLAREPWREVCDRTLAVHAAATGHAPGAAGRLRDLRQAARQLTRVVPDRPSEAVDLTGRHGEVELALARAMGAVWLDRYMSEWRHVKLSITGDDLLAAGIPEGPAIGRGLKAALRAKLDQRIAGWDEELDVALQAAMEHK